MMAKKKIGKSPSGRCRKINSRAKGAAGEREWRDMLRAAGWPNAERGQQHAGGADSPDVRGGPPGIHFEVKRVDALRLIPALEQAGGDSRSNQVPIVAWRPNGARWVCLLWAEDMLQLLWLAERGAKDLGYADLQAFLAILGRKR